MKRREGKPMGELYHGEGGRQLEVLSTKEKRRKYRDSGDEASILRRGKNRFQIGEGGMRNREGSSAPNIFSTKAKRRRA